MRDIVGRRKLWFTIPCVVLVVTLVASLVFGVELDINFRGGSLVTYSFEGSVDKGQFEDTIQQAFGQQISVQEQQDVVTGRTNYVANLSVKEGISPDQQIAITSALQEKFPDNKIEVVSTSNVDPAIGRDFFVKSMVAVAAAAVRRPAGAQAGRRHRRLRNRAAGRTSAGLHAGQKRPCGESAGRSGPACRTRRNVLSH